MEVVMNLERFKSYVYREYGATVSDEFERKLARRKVKASYQIAFKVLDQVLAPHLAKLDAEKPKFGRTNSPGPRIVFHNRKPRRLP